MAITRQDGKHNIRGSAKKASTAIAIGEILTVDANGFLLPATSAATNLAGIAMQRAGSDDLDYASTGLFEFDAPRPSDQFMIDVDTVPAQTNVGEFFDLANSTSVALATNTIHHVKCVGVVIGPTAATSKLIVQFNPLIEYQA